MKTLSKIVERSYSVFSVLFLFVVSAQAQDYIYMKDGSEWKAKVEEITPEIIKFKKFDQPDGPVRTVKVQDVMSIKYQDGSEENFTKVEEKAPEKTTEEQYVYSYDNKVEEQQPKKPKSKFELNGHNKYVCLGLGFGNSYGGAGTRFQFRTGGMVGFGLHVGLGVYPNPFNYVGTGSFAKRIQFDFGVKLFVYKWAYIDFQLGMVGRDHDYYLYNTGDRSDFSDVLFGPALLSGVDYIFGKHIGLNIAGGVSFPFTGVEGNGGSGPPSPKTNTYPAIDAGVFYKF